MFFEEGIEDWQDVENKKNLGPQKYIKKWLKFRPANQKYVVIFGTKISNNVT
jgi:hypothetical protein